MPVAETKPSTAASPCSCVSRSTSPSVQPACARAVRCTGSTHTPLISDMSIIRPPSQTASPAMLWPPPRTDTRSRCWRAKRTACTTSAVPVQRSDEAGPAIDHRVPDVARLFVGGVVRRQHGPLNPALNDCRTSGEMSTVAAIQPGELDRHASTPFVIAC